MLNNEIKNDAVLVVNNLVKKPRIAEMLCVSLRQVDNYLADGCPHQKPSRRSVRFDENEVMLWFKNKYGQQRRKTVSNN